VGWFTANVRRVDKKTPADAAVAFGDEALGRAVLLEEDGADYQSVRAHLRAAGINVVAFDKAVRSRRDARKKEAERRRAARAEIDLQRDIEARRAVAQLQQRAPEHPETEAAEFLRLVLDRLEEHDEAGRSAAVFADDFLDAAIAVGPGSPDYQRVLVRLGEMGVKLSPFKDAVKGRRAKQRAERHAEEQAAHPRADRPTIIITEEEDKVNAQAVSALAGLGDLYQRGHQIVTVVESQDLVPGAPAPVRRLTIRALDPAVLRERFTTAAAWRVWRRDSETGDAQLVPAHPPEWSVRAVHGYGQWRGWRSLITISECPILRPDGSILMAQGWDPATGILLMPSDDFPEVPNMPTPQDVLAARDLLLDVVRDFPFESGPRGHHVAAWLAGVLTAVGRYAFSGPAPLFCVDGNAPGTGKSLLAEISALIIAGRPMCPMTYVDDEIELDKRILSIAIAGDQLVLIDNIDRPLGDATIDAALTATEWGGRMLGVSIRPKAPLVATWWATGNNIQLKATIARRVLMIRLDTREERPAERQGLRDLRAYVRENRPALVMAALTLLRAWEATGRDLAELDVRAPLTVGSYEQWGSLVQGAVMFCGLPDPSDALGSRDEAIHDQDAVGLAELLSGWDEAVRKIGGDVGGCTVADVLTKLQDNDEKRRSHDPPPLLWPHLREALGEVCTGVPVGRLPNVRQVGYAFRRLKKRVIGGRRLAGRKSNGKFVWAVEATVPVRAAEPVLEVTPT
jgi:hypothetical protein